MSLLIDSTISIEIDAATYEEMSFIMWTLICLCRNNLTIMDTVVLTGQGCQGEMKFSNRKPGSQSPLTFEITEKHLKSCDSEYYILMK